MVSDVVLDDVSCSCARIDDLSDPRVADYRNVPDPELLREHGVFVAEGRLAVRTLLRASRYRTRSLLVTDSALRSLRAVLDDRTGDGRMVPTFISTPVQMREIVGYNVHRGCLALGERSVPMSPADVLPASARLVIILEALGNADNVGGVFRNAAAFGAQAVLLSPGCCDPLYRKAIRVSTAASLRVPFAQVPDWPDGLAALGREGFTVVALTPDDEATDIDEFIAAGRPDRVALLVGTEGDGLSSKVKALADVRVRIPMAPGIDSLNVATAAGIALHGFRHR